MAEQVDNTPVEGSEVPSGTGGDTQLTEQQIVEQEAIAKYRQSQGLDQDPNEMPEGYNPDGTPQEDLIGGKFKSQEDLLQAYQELEKKLSNPPASDDSQGNGEDETPAGETPPDDKQTEDNGVDTKVNIEKYGQELQKNGSLSEDSYKELADMGFSKQDVDNYIATRQVMASNFTNTVYERAGGNEAYTELVTWASENMPRAVIDDYNTALSNADTDRVTNLIDLMKFKKGESDPQAPRRLEGEADSYNGVQPFSDKSEWQRYTSNRLYGRDQKFTRMVDNRYLASRKKGLI